MTAAVGRRERPGGLASRTMKARAGAAHHGRPSRGAQLLGQQLAFVRVQVGYRGPNRLEGRLVRALCVSQLTVDDVGHLGAGKAAVCLPQLGGAGTPSSVAAVDHAPRGGEKIARLTCSASHPR